MSTGRRSTADSVGLLLELDPELGCLLAPERRAVAERELRVRIALLDRPIGTQLAAYPEIEAAIVDRLSERAQRLAVTQAISRLNKVEDRVPALFWHLAERSVGARVGRSELG